MPGPLPTPLVAYCVKALGASAGIMITASHNPPADNGFKLYASDGAQIIAPNDEIVERFARDDDASLRIAYTPLHGVGGEFMMGLFARAGHRGVNPVAEQFEPDAAF